MELENKLTTASDSDLLHAGAAPKVNTPFAPRESAAPTAADDPIPTARMDGPSIGPEERAPQRTSSITAPEASFTGPETSASHRRTANPVVKVSGIEETVRSGKTAFTYWKPPFDVEKGFEGSIIEIKERAELVLAPLCAIPAPTGASFYGTTEALFLRLQKAIAAQASLSEQASTLAAHWTLSTWFSDALSFAPGLAIIGSAYEGDLVLRTLRNYCRYPLMLTRADISTLKNVNWQINPTLLFYDPNVTKQMASLLGCSATRGHLVSDAGSYKDFYGPKAIYLGEEVSIDRTPLCSVQVNVLSTATACATEGASRLRELEVQELQNMLLQYRLKNLVRVYHSDFDASHLTSDTRAIANALGACIVDSPELQSRLVSLLTTFESQRQADRSTGTEAVTLEATLNLCHEGKAKILVGEIATEVNRIVKARGERLHYSAETIGHRLKKIGLFTRRLGKAGKGLVMDLATTTRAHELAAVYGGVGLDQQEGNLHCQLCVEKK